MTHKVTHEYRTWVCERFASSEWTTCWCYTRKTQTCMNSQTNCKYSQLSCRQHLIMVGVAHNQERSPGLCMGINMPKHDAKWPAKGTSRNSPFLVGTSLLPMIEASCSLATNWLGTWLQQNLIINIKCIRNLQLHFATTRSTINTFHIHVCDKLHTRVTSECSLLTRFYSYLYQGYTHE